MRLVVKVKVIALKVDDATRSRTNSRCVSISSLMTGTITTPLAGLGVSGGDR